jgi:hypothetical protein
MITVDPQACLNEMLEHIPVRLTHIRRERNNWHIPEY